MIEINPVYPLMSTLARVGPGPKLGTRIRIQIFHRHGRNPMTGAITTALLGLNWQEVRSKGPEPENKPGMWDTDISATRQKVQSLYNSKNKAKTLPEYMTRIYKKHATPELSVIHFEC